MTRNHCGRAGRLSWSIKKGGKYYLAATARFDLSGDMFQGMIVATNADGIDWGTAWDVDYVEYSDMVVDPFNPLYTDPASALNVYGHYWVPDFVFKDPDRLYYVFSVWKWYQGFFDDFFFFFFFFFFFAADERTFPISEAGRFREYNTKMYWYDLP